MAAQLRQCTKSERRAVIGFLDAEGIKTSNIYKGMKEQYGESCLTERKAYEWAELFKNGRTCMDDLPRSGRPNTSVTEAK